VNPNAEHRFGVSEIIQSFMRNYGLISQMTRREVVGRYRGSILGLAWSFFIPLIMLAVYTIVFSTVFNAKWGVGSESKTEFALLLFIGMIVHRLLADSMNMSVTLITKNVSYVKKVVFPLEILSYVQLGAIIFHVLISLLVWTCFYALINMSLQWTILFFPLVIAPLIIFSLGVSWMVSSMGVYVRDIGQITGVLTTMLLFLSPIFYPASRLPEPFLTIIYLNPLTFIIEQSREVLYWGNIPDINGIIISYIISLVFAWLGFATFQKTRKGFADVM
jgi:lipopolysaccharide transport system permease protein